jgi:hypothetical protein
MILGLSLVTDRYGGLKRYGQMHRPQVCISLSQDLAQGFRRVQHVVRSTVRAAYQRYNVVEDIAASWPRCGGEVRFGQGATSDRCRAERELQFDRDAEAYRFAEFTPLCPTCVYTYRRPP